MTLNTSVYIVDPDIDAEWLFQWCNDNLIKPGRYPNVYHQNIGDKYTYGDGVHTKAKVGNHIGQGFCAILDITHRNNELIDELADLGPKPEGDENDTWEWDHAEEVPKHYIEVNFDTAYGYSDERGYNCTMLHAEFISKLVSMLHVKGVKVIWTNEYRGTYHAGMDLDGMKQFLEDGGSATSWFYNKVKPAIERAAEAGGTI